jgi:hypothetical protein
MNTRVYIYIHTYKLTNECNYTAGLVQVQNRPRARQRPGVSPSVCTHTRIRTRRHTRAGCIYGTHDTAHTTRTSGAR